ncbi:hypothetical protein DSO57_1013882 [Entomophthora muscae]|uniref:Uncharacterized protein n=1 Tax=Entomophthora muscae TaxID=34485 RepID=A0ACC2SV02_9FUNG|nr:hypothetical protein DSO57_1013882 [Entomophthora muscae]
MTPPLTPRLDRPLEPPAASKTRSTQLFGLLYITLTVLVDSMVANSGPWSLLGQSVSYIIKLAPILWWALPASSATPYPKPSNTSTYDWLPENILQQCLYALHREKHSLMGFEIETQELINLEGLSTSHVSFMSRQLSAFYQLLPFHVESICKFS